MPTSEPLHVAFVWHMHQPYYRSARTGVFGMPWARLHALKDYLDMVEILGAYPDLHQTFNLVPSLVEQLEDYASGDFSDTYWDCAMKPAADLDPGERAFVVERLCERPDHPRARAHPRYLELARKREAGSAQGWDACARTFTIHELRDLQVWSNLAWFDPKTLEAEPLCDLVSRGRDYREEDKRLLAQVQADILARTIPSYRDAARRGQIELSTSPYFHPILPLLANSDSARVAAPDTLLPPRRFAHPEDAAEQVKSAVDKHERVFGERPRGIWCSEQAVGEDVVPLLISAGLTWTISDETVLARSLSGAAARRDVLPAAGGSGLAAGSAGGAGLVAASPAAIRPGSPYVPCRLEREGGEIAIVFRDHTLSDLIGFAYRSWDSRDAAADLLKRLRELRMTLAAAPAPSGASPRPPLVTIALDGENAWEYYPRDGRDFLQYLYEGLSTEPSLRCLSVSEHLREAPPSQSLDWLHTGSWIGGDLRTWSGDKGHNVAWELLRQARDLAASRRGPVQGRTVSGPQAAAWRHVLIAEGSDWFWWFGDHHHTDLDQLWDLSFRLHLQEVYRLLGEPIPLDLFLPILEQAPDSRPVPPRGALDPVIDGLASDPAEWETAGILARDLSSTMQPSGSPTIGEVRFGWRADSLCLLVVPGPSTDMRGVEVEVKLSRPAGDAALSLRLVLEEEGRVEVSWGENAYLAGSVEAAWDKVLEVDIPLDMSACPAAGRMALVVNVGHGGIIEQVFHSAGLASLGWRGQ